MAELKFYDNLITMTMLEVDGCHEIWMNFTGSDPEDAFCIGASEIAAGGTRESAIANAKSILEEALVALAQLAGANDLTQPTTE